MIYFDNSATTKPHPDAIDTYQKVANHYFANPSSLHYLGQKVRDLIEEARKQIAELMVVSEKEIIFTSGGTEGNNLAIKGIVNKYQNRGKHIITSEIEHPSVKEVMRYLEKIGFNVAYLPVDQTGKISLTDLKETVRSDTILVSLMHVNNEVGSIQPIEEIANWLKKNTDAFFHVDNVQGCTKVPLDITNIDLLTISGHKIHGLKGTGFLMKKSSIQLAPELRGGGQEYELRSGTENTPGIVALAKAFRLALLNEQKNRQNLYEIRDYIIAKLNKMRNVVIHTDKKNAAPHIICFSAKGHRGEILVNALFEAEIIVSTTSACSSRSKRENSTLRAMKVNDKEAVGAIRISLSYQNTMEEAKIFIEKFAKILKKLNGVVK